MVSSAIGYFEIGISPIEGSLSQEPNAALPIQNFINSYLYTTYQDDDNIAAFLEAYNRLAQEYLDWFNQTTLSDYTNANVSDGLLDWVGSNLYGLTRRALPTGDTKQIGPLNTFAFNTMAMNHLELLGPTDFFATSDDIYRRIITWNFYKGDGNVFNIRWLKRRVQRFLTGENGTAGRTDATYEVSVTFGVGNQVTIRILDGIRTLTGGSIYNEFPFNTETMNNAESSFTTLPPQPDATIFQAAVNSGVLQLPFQYEFTVVVG